MMKHHKRWIGVLLIGSFLLGACGGGGVSRGRYKMKATSEMIKEFKRAEQLYRRRRNAQALTAFQQYIETHPYHRLTDQSRLRVGQIYLQLGKPKESLRWFQAAVRGVYDIELTPEALYLAMQAHLRLGQLDQAWRILRQMRWGATRGHHRILIASLGIHVGQKIKQASVESSLPLYLEIIDAYIVLSKRLRHRPSWLIGGEKARQWVRRWVETAEGDRGALKKLAKRFVGKSSGGYVIYKLAKLSYEAGKTNEARDYYDQYVRAYPKHEYVPQARIRLAELGRKVDSDYAAVGVILPLSGRYGSYGKAVLRGIQCSAGVFEPCSSDLKVRLVIRDSAGDPVKATAAFQNLMASEQVVGAIGPLAQVEVGAVAKQADQYQVPLIALSQKQGIANSSPYVFRNFLTIEDQVQTLARYVCASQLREVAILHPKTRLGQTYRDIFTQEVERCEGKVKATASYDPTQGNYQDGIRGLKFSIQKHKLGAEIGFEALFIPDSYSNLSKIIPLLAFHNVKGVQLLGAAGWNNPKLVNTHPEAMEGAIFVGGFFSNSSAGPTRRFTQNFRHAFGGEPSFLEAYGYDSMQLIQRALKQKRSASRQELRDMLLRTKSFPGATGAITFDNSGDAKRHLVILTVKDGKIRELE